MKLKPFLDSNQWRWNANFQAQSLGRKCIYWLIWHDFSPPCRLPCALLPLQASCRLSSAGSEESKLSPPGSLCSQSAELLRARCWLMLDIRPHEDEDFLDSVQSIGSTGWGFYLEEGCRQKRMQWSSLLFGDRIYPIFLTRWIYISPGWF